MFYTKHQTAGGCVIESPSDTRHYFEIRARTRGCRSVSRRSRAAGRGQRMLAIATHTLRPLTEVQQPPWLSAFPEPLAQIHA